MYKTNHKISNFALIKNVEKSFFNKLKELYIYSGCWTWDTNYEPPSIEIFYLLKDYKIESKNLSKNEVLKVSKVPLNMINMKFGNGKAKSHKKCYLKCTICKLRCFDSTWLYHHKINYCYKSL